MQTIVKNVPTKYQSVYIANSHYDYTQHKTVYRNMCSCGWYEESTSPVGPENCCPHCGTPLLTTDYNSWRGVNGTFRCIYLDVRTTCNHDVLWSKRIFKVESDQLSDGSYRCVHKLLDTFVVHYNFLQSRLDIYKNGCYCEKNTSTLLQSCTSYVTDSMLPDKHLLSCVCDYINTSSIYKAVSILTKVPSLEVLYNTYGDLRMLQGLEIEHIVPNATTPHKALGMCRTVYKSFKNCGTSLNRYYKDLSDLYRHFINKPDIVATILSKYIKELPSQCIPNYIQLIIHNNYDPQHLFDYCTDLVYTYQGIKSPKLCLELLTDYINMCTEMRVSYDRFPKSLKLVHDMAAKNYTLYADEITKRDFTEFVSSTEYTSLELESCEKPYVVVAPKNIEDLINEGRSLSHCVDSYVNHVAAKNRKILFMRDSKTPNVPLVTLDIRGNHIVQYAGFDNRRLTDSEMDYLKYYAEKKGLVIS